jgi:hypothetical protein
MKRGLAQGAYPQRMPSRRALVSTELKMADRATTAKQHATNGTAQHMYVRFRDL